MLVLTRAAQQSSEVVEFGLYACHSFHARAHLLVVFQVITEAIAEREVLKTVSVFPKLDTVTMEKTKTHCLCILNIVTSRLGRLKMQPT